MSLRNIPKRLSDSQRRTVCRLAFMLCVIVPTLFAVRLVFSPSSNSGIETALRAATGISATIQSVQTPRPGIYTLNSVELPGPNDRMLQLGTVHVAAGNICQIGIPETVRIDCSELTKLVQQFCGATLPTTPAGLKSITPVFLRCRRLVVSDRDFPDDPARQLILSPIEFHFAADSGGSIASLRFQIAGSTAAQQIEITVSKPVNDPAGGVQVHVVTGETLIPVWLAKAIWPEADSLLPTGQFSGQIEMAVDEGGRSQGLIKGSVSQADLQQLFGWTSLDMTGSAQLVNLHCAVEAGRIRSFSAILSAQSGTIGPAALNTMAELGWQTARPVAGEQKTGYRHFQLECRFENGRAGFGPRNDAGVVAWTEDGVAVVSSPLSQTVEPMESLARRIFQNPGSSPASIATLGDRAVGFLGRFNLATESVGEGPVQYRMAETRQGTNDRF